MPTVQGRPHTEPLPAMADTLAIAVPLIQRWEGLRLRPYLCSAGVATIGYGSTRHIDGRRVALTDPPITREYADRLFTHTLTRDYLPAVRALCPGIDNARREAALLSICYNIGTGALRASTLRRKVNAGLWADVPAQLMRWTRASGQEVRGLVRRRTAEADLVRSTL